MIANVLLVGFRESSKCEGSAMLRQWAGWTGIAVMMLLSIDTSASTTRAVTVTYTFESPIFSAGQTTPLLNVAPNQDQGASSFRTDFTSSGLQIFSIRIPTLTGQSLGYGSSSTGGLALSFNTPVDRVEVNFFLPFPSSINENDSFDITTPVGRSSTLALRVDPFSPTSGWAGTAIFTSATPFTSLTFSAGSWRGRTQFAIDNLRLTTAAAAPVPEPGSAALLATGIGVAGVVVLRRRRVAA
jgi:hypothetical protein